MRPSTRTLLLLVTAPAVMANKQCDCKKLKPLAEAAVEASKLPESQPFGDRINTGTSDLRGLVDMHAHPMAHLAFGGKVLFGGPDSDSLMPAGTLMCNASAVRASGVSEALGTCYSVHGGWDAIDNGCGDEIRREVLGGVQNGIPGAPPPTAHLTPHPEGWEAFDRWPQANDVLHQVMYVDWLERAYQGGLRVMVALAVNNRTLALGVSGNPPYDDKTSGDAQIAEMKHFVGRHDFMEIAYSPDDLRRIVGDDDRLAIVLGVELDDMGNLTFDRIGTNTRLAHSTIENEIQRLHGLGVRYFFPIHTTDNLFGGSALYTPTFAVANRHQTGEFFQVICADESDGINLDFQWQSSADDLGVFVKLGYSGADQPLPSGCKAGHKNKKGLTDAGRVALDELMRLGVLIDVDHMSNRMLRDTLDHTGDYPLVSGHSSLRDPDDPESSERSLTPAEYAELGERGGLAGVGWALGAEDFADAVAAVRATGVAVALGTDANGLSPLPGARPVCFTGECVSYSDDFPRSTFGERTWDYNAHGVAHYGLMPDFMRDVAGLSQTGRDAVFEQMGAAEAFARTWERSIELSAAGP